MADMTGIEQLERSIAGEKKDKEMLRIWDYLYRLTEELRYVLSHLDEENMSQRAAEIFSRMQEGLPQAQVTQELRKAADRATKLITGNRGGYVVLRDTDEDGKPDEILVMDAAQAEEARNIWRWNAAGLGHSSTGYEGPYTTAITQDGQIVADFVTTGTLNAQLVRVIHLAAETVRSQEGDFTLSIEAAKLKLLENGASRVILRSDVDNGGYLQLNKALADGDTQYTILFADQMVLGGHMSDSDQIDGTLTAGEVYAKRMKAQDVIAGENEASLAHAQWKTVTIGGTQMKVLVST